MVENVKHNIKGIYPSGLLLKKLIQEDIFMERQSKMTPERKAFINSLLEH